VRKRERERKEERGNGNYKGKKTNGYVFLVQDGLRPFLTTLRSFEDRVYGPCDNLGLRWIGLTVGSTRGRINDTQGVVRSMERDDDRERDRSSDFHESLCKRRSVEIPRLGSLLQTKTRIFNALTASFPRNPMPLFPSFRLFIGHFLATCFGDWNRYIQYVESYRDRCKKWVILGAQCGKRAASKDVRAASYCPVVRSPASFSSCDAFVAFRRGFTCSYV
jgi:hypothetical protein